MKIQPATQPRTAAKPHRAHEIAREDQRQHEAQDLATRGPYTEQDREQMNQRGARGADAPRAIF